MVKNKFKKWMLLAPILLTLPTIALTACGYKPAPYTNNFSADMWDKADSWAIGEVINWKDGDTVDVKLKMKDIGEEIKVAIRVSDIDTPESKKPDGKKWVDSVEPELSYAKQATKFAKELIPIGTKVKIWFNSTNGVPEKSHDRWVGNIFYGENFSKSYEVETIAQGWSIPTFEKIWLSENYRSEHYLAKQAALAFNEAWYHKRGIHDKRDNSTTDYIHRIFLTRGDGDYTGFLFYINTSHPLSDKKDNFWMLEMSK